jgi:hypothetical protein
MHLSAVPPGKGGTIIAHVGSEVTCYRACIDRGRKPLRPLSVVTSYNKLGLTHKHIRVWDYDEGEC